MKLKLLMECKVMGEGIRFINNNKIGLLLRNITVQSCKISNIGHSGIKITGSVQNLKLVTNSMFKTGGPGIQMGTYAISIDEHFVNYARPQESENKSDVRWEKFFNNTNEGFKINSDKSLNFSSGNIKQRN
jgi:hypothetical protein